MEIQRLWTSRYAVFTILFILLCSYSYFQPATLVKVVIINNTTVKPVQDIPNVSEPKYLINTSKCKIPNLNIWNEEVAKLFVKEPYVSCSKHPLLTYIEKNATYAKVKIDRIAGRQYTKQPIICCYKWVERSSTVNVPDENISISKKCIDFDEEVVINNKTVMVTCRDKKHLYSNVHVAVTINNEQYDNMQKIKESSSTNKTKPISLIIIGIDSISRLNFYRTMPLTKTFLNDNDWIEYMGYNKMGENTFPNLIAILTGKTPEYAYKKCDPTVRGKLETCPFIWNDFKKHGYVTAYGEDEDQISTFNYKKKGFVEKPTDFYFKSYMHGAGKLATKIVDDMHYCTGPEQSGMRILNLVKDFSKTFLGHPMFGLFWMNSFSHNKVNSPTRLDKHVANFLKDLKNDGVLDEVMIIFLSDHGMRFGQIRQTTSGWIEERLPYLYFWIPPWLRQTRPNEYNNLRNNAKRLTSPYDMYMTIQDILVLSNFTYTSIQSDGCPMCQSLFKEINDPRSCEETGISTHWCTCNGYVPIKTDNKLVNQSAIVTLEWIQSKIKELVPGTKKCAKYALAKIMSASLSENKINTNENTTSTHILLMFETIPKAIFETTVTVTRNNNLDDSSINNQEKFKVLYVSRLDEYKPHSGCIEDARAKNYCYCNKR